jgi:hypothetical protein
VTGGNSLALVVTSVHFHDMDSQQVTTFSA